MNKAVKQPTKGRYQMTITYEAIGWSKFSEVDNYKEGCLPNTGNSYSDKSMIFKGNTIKEAVQECLDFVDATIEDAELNACDENGRLDVSIMEDEDGCKAAENEIASWKEGKTILYLSVYTFYITKIERETITLIYN